MKRITIADAIKLLEQDTTARKDVFFVVGNSHKDKVNCQYDRDFSGYVCRIDRGQITGSIKTRVCELATMSLMGGIYVRA